MPSYQKEILKRDIVRTVRQNGPSGIDTRTLINQTCNNLRASIPTLTIYNAWGMLGWLIQSDALKLTVRTPGHSVVKYL